MPKETIRPVGHSTFNLEVKWSKEAEYLQLGTVMLPPDPDQAQNLLELIKQWSKSTPEASDTYDPGRGLYATLTRYDVNNLIRVLRRARDQAFGKDE